MTKPGVPWMSRASARAVRLQRRLNLRRGHFAFQAIDIEPNRFRDLVDCIFGDLARRGHHRVVKRLVFSLPMRRQRRAGGGD
jgi:hypothetical protein